MDFDLNDLITNNAANKANASTKFQPKAKPKALIRRKSAQIPSNQSVDTVTVANHGGSEEKKQPENDVNQISGNINDNRQSSFEKAERENNNAHIQLESLDDILPQPTTVTETPAGHVCSDGNIEKEHEEPQLNNTSEMCTNLDRLAEVDPLMGEEAAILNNNGDFHIENLALEVEDAEKISCCEPLDFLSDSRSRSGPKVGKFKPKPKAQTRKLAQKAIVRDQDEVETVSCNENIQSVHFQTMDEGAVPSLEAVKILDQSSMRVDDSGANLHVDEDSMNNMTEASQVDVSDISTTGIQNTTHEELDPTLNQHRASESDLKNQACRSSERLRNRKNKTFELIDESDHEGLDEDVIHDNEDNNADDYEVDNESLNARKESKSKKFVGEKEKSVKKRKKGSTVPVESTQPAKKKFSHSTRRIKRQVNPDLLKIPEEELELHNLPMKELIRLAEHREKMAKKEASMETPATNQSASNFSSHYDYDDAFTEGMGSAYEHDHSMEAENATYYNYRTHMKMTPRMKWTKQDTELFYEAIQQFGTDLSMIKECFPGRTREQIKSKYKKEERQHPSRLNDALTTRAKGHTHFEVVIERLKQALGKESDKGDSVDLTGEENEEMVADELNEKDAKKPENFDEEVKESEAKGRKPVPVVESPTKSHDSDDDDMNRWSHYTSDI